VRSQLKQRKGGTDDARLIAVVTMTKDQEGRRYRLPVTEDLVVVEGEKKSFNNLKKNASNDAISPIPDEILPLMSGTFNVPLYGISHWRNMFTHRQKLALLTLIEEIKSLSKDYLKELFACVLGRCADYWSSGVIWAQDYYAVPYADLSDFFFVWLKRAIPEHPLMHDPLDANNPLTPKDRELCEMSHWDIERYAHKDKDFFEDGMATAFSEGRRVLKEDGIGCVVFAHKTTEGWEALLSGMIRGGWTLTGSWPIVTEHPGRLRSHESAALATSVHLVCRPRPEDAPVGDWGEVLRELPKRVKDWMERL